MDLTEHFVEQKSAVKGQFMTLLCDRIRLPDGSHAHREYLKHPGAVVILAQLANGDILLERQFRYPVGKVCIELPAGKIDPNEDRLLCAQRELQEETGYRAERWQEITGFHNAIGYSNERLTLFLAQDLQPGPARLDQGEFLEVFSQPLADCLAQVMDGTIDDVKTMIGLMWLALNPALLQ